MTTPKIRVPIKRTANALTPHSLLGSAAELEKYALEQKPLLGSICLTGEATVYFGKYGRGKTLFLLYLLFLAIEEGRILPHNVFYINADDSGAGLALKVRLCQDYGIHILSPGHKAFSASMLRQKMRELIEADQARGVFIILDTLKKFFDPMEKKAAREFTEVVREFVLRGGTLLALAHINKNPGRDGKPVPEGTADVLNDFDCAYVIDDAGEIRTTAERVVEFTREKSRGSVALSAKFAYDPDPNLDYVQRLCSVRQLDDDDDFYMPPVSEEEVDIVLSIEMCIEHGTNTKMAIANAVAKGLRHVSGREALRVLEKYTGDDPSVHRWNYTVGERGAMVYTLLEGRTPLG